MSDKPWVFEVHGDRLVVIEKGTCDPLDGSIQKWAAIVRYMEGRIYDPLGPDDGGSFTCPACIAYFYSDRDCGPCPISLDGHSGCEGTPFYSYSESGGLSAAKAELEYLRDLKARLEEAGT